MEFWAGLAIGFLGSLHCLGMCGPLALALPVPGTGRTAFLLGRLLYNLGRVVTYTILGAGIGSVGRIVVLSGWQQALSITAGVVILLALFLPKAIHCLTASVSRLTSLSSFVRGEISALFQRRGTTTLFLIGILNGFLPCGFVYIGLAGAATTGAPLLAAVFMTGFGLGTLPMMFGVSVAGRLLHAGVRRKLRAFVPVLTAVVAVLIILRGMNLGIPYLSPSTSGAHDRGVPGCCR